MEVLEWRLDVPQLKKLKLEKGERQTGPMEVVIQAPNWNNLTPAVNYLEDNFKRLMLMVAGVLELFNGHSSYHL